MPPQPPTVALKKDDIIQAQLKQVIDGMSSFRSEMSTGIAHLTADVQLVSNDLGIVKDRVAIIEGWKNDQDARASRTSKRVQQVSDSDLSQEAKLADLIVWRTTVATKDDLAKTTLAQTNQLIDSLKKNPIVSKALTIIGTAIITYLATHFGVHL